MVKCDKVTAPDIICGLNAAAQFCCTIIVRPLSTTKFTGTFPRLTRIGQQGLLRVGIGVLVFVGDALGIVHDELREEEHCDLRSLLIQSLLFLQYSEYRIQMEKILLDRLVRILPFSQSGAAG